MRRRRRSNGGFSLVEVLVAIAILVGALTMLSRVFVMATRANGAARGMTQAAIAARDKMEQLRGLAWGEDSSGLPVTDPALDSSPPGALDVNVPTYCDFLDARGRRLGTGAGPPSGTAVVRRWSVEPVPGGGDRTIVLQVVAFPWRGVETGAANAAGGVRLVGVRTRTMW